MRGWIEPLEGAVPHGELAPDGRLPAGELFKARKPVYRLTEAGWAALNRTHGWLLATFYVSSAALLATILGMWLTWGGSR